MVKILDTVKYGLKCVTKMIMLVSLSECRVNPCNLRGIKKSTETLNETTVGENDPTILHDCSILSALPLPKLGLSIPLNCLICTNVTRSKRILTTFD